MAARRCASVVLAATVLAVVAGVGVFALGAEEAGARGGFVLGRCMTDAEGAANRA